VVVVTAHYFSVMCCETTSRPTKPAFVAGNFSRGRGAYAFMCKREFVYVGESESGERGRERERRA